MLKKRFLKKWKKTFTNNKLLQLIIPLLLRFTILGHRNTQTMSRYYAVKQAKNRDGKRSNEKAALNDPHFGFFLCLTFFNCKKSDPLKKFVALKSCKLFKWIRFFCYVKTAQCVNRIRYIYRKKLILGLASHRNPAGIVV